MEDHVNRPPTMGTRVLINDRVSVPRSYWLRSSNLVHKSIEGSTRFRLIGYA